MSNLYSIFALGFVTAHCQTNVSPCVWHEICSKLFINLDLTTRFY